MNILPHLSELLRAGKKLNAHAELLNIRADLAQSSYGAAIDQLKQQQDLNNEAIRLMVAPDIIGAALSIQSVNQALLGIDTYLNNGAWYIGVQDKTVIYSPGA